MNKKEKYWTKKEAESLLDFSLSKQRAGNKKQRCGFPGGLDHARKIFEICYELNKKKKTFYTEAIFKNGGRADIFVLDDCIAIEVMDSEDMESIADKMKRYPCQVYFLTVKQIVNDIMELME